MNKFNKKISKLANFLYIGVKICNMAKNTFKKTIGVENKIGLMKKQYKFFFIL